MKRKKLIDICIPIGRRKKIKCPGDDCSVHKRKGKRERERERKFQQHFTCLIGVMLCKKMQAEIMGKRKKEMKKK